MLLWSGRGGPVGTGEGDFRGRHQGVPGAAGERKGRTSPGHGRFPSRNVGMGAHLKENSFSGVTQQVVANVG